MGFTVPSVIMARHMLLTVITPASLFILNPCCYKMHYYTSASLTSAQGPIVLIALSYIWSLAGCRWCLGTPILDTTISLYVMCEVIYCWAPLRSLSIILKAQAQPPPLLSYTWVELNLTVIFSQKDLTKTALMRKNWTIQLLNWNWWCN